VRWVPEKMRRYLYEKDGCRGKRLLRDRYEFLLFRQIKHGVDAGDVFCRDSVRFRSISDDRIRLQRHGVTPVSCAIACQHQRAFWGTVRSARNRSSEIARAAIKISPSATLKRRGAGSMSAELPTTKTPGARMSLAKRRL
jgi:hypothetical protein